MQTQNAPTQADMIIAFVRENAATLKAEMNFGSQPAILLVDAHREYLMSKTEKERNQNRKWLVEMYTRYIEIKQVNS